MKLNDLIVERTNLQSLVKSASRLVGTVKHVFGDDADDLETELKLQPEEDVLQFYPETQQQIAAHRSLLQSAGRKVGGLKVVRMIGGRLAIIRGDKVFIPKFDHSSLVEGKAPKGSKLELVLNAVEQSKAGENYGLSKVVKKLAGMSDEMIDYAAQIFSARNGNINATYITGISRFIKPGGDAYNLWWNLTRHFETTPGVSDPLNLKELKDAAGTMASLSENVKNQIVRVEALLIVFDALHRTARSNSDLEGELAAATLDKLGAKVK